MKRLIIPSRTQYIKEAVASLSGYASQKLRKIDIHELEIALSEALSNAMLHGNKAAPDKMVIADARVRSDSMIFTITDEGSGFDYHAVNDPRTKENMLKEYGRGLFLIRNFMDEVHFSPSGNRITLIKYIKKGHKRHAKKNGKVFPIARLHS